MGDTRSALEITEQGAGRFFDEENTLHSAFRAFWIRWAAVGCVANTPAVSFRRVVRACSWNSAGRGRSNLSINSGRLSAI